MSSLIAGAATDGIIARRSPWTEHRYIERYYVEQKFYLSLVFRLDSDISGLRVTDSWIKKSHHYNTIIRFHLPRCKKHSIIWTTFLVNFYIFIRVYGCKTIEEGREWKLLNRKRYYMEEVFVKRKAFLCKSIIFVEWKPTRIVSYRICLGSHSVINLQFAFIVHSKVLFKIIISYM